MPPPWSLLACVCVVLRGQAEHLDGGYYRVCSARKRARSYVVYETIRSSLMKFV